MSMVLLHLMISLIIAYNVTKALPVFLDRRFNGNIAEGLSGILLFIVCLFPIIPAFVPTFIFFCIIFSLIVIVFYKGSPFRRIAFSAIFFSIIGAWSFLTVTCLGISALYDPPLWLENTILILLTALCILYFTIFSEYVGNADKESLDSFTERLWGYTAFIALCPPVIMLLAVMNPPDHPLETLLITCFIVAASTAMIPLICHIGTSARLARENARLKEQTEYYKEIEREQTQIRKFKHDLMNHFTVVATYLDLGESEKAIEYFKRIGADFAKISRRYTENPLINAVLNAKYQKATGCGIELRITANADTAGMDESTDLCTIIANALDNAIEAAPPDKNIDVVLTEDGDRLLFICSNSYSNEIRRGKDGSFLTGKDDTRSHGLGIRNIRRAVERLDGDIEITAEDGVFTVRASIPFSKERNR